MIISVRHLKNIINEIRTSGYTLADMVATLNEYSRHTWIFFDTETTGLHPKDAQLTQIAAIAISPETGEILGVFNKKIKFTDEIYRLMSDPQSHERLRWDKKNKKSRNPLKEPRSILSLNRYGERGIKYETEESVLNDFQEFIQQFQNPLIIAQNASFDMKFVNTRSGGILKNYPVLDTLRLIQNYLLPLLKTASESGDTRSTELLGKLKSKRGYAASQGAVAAAFNIDVGDWHNALGDVKMLMQMYSHILSVMSLYNTLDISREAGKAWSKTRKF